jgi:hypothetical protein
LRKAGLCQLQERAGDCRDASLANQRAAHSSTAEPCCAVLSHLHVARVIKLFVTALYALTAFRPHHLTASSFDGLII